MPMPDIALFVAASALLAIAPGPDVIYVLTRAVSQGGESRPAVPIVSLCTSLKVCRQLSISRGVVPAHVAAPPPSAADAATTAVAAGLLPPDEPLVVLCDGSLQLGVVGMLRHLGGDVVHEIGEINGCQRARC